MSYIGTKNLTVSQAHDLKALGFILRLISIGFDTDRYHVYVI